MAAVLRFWDDSYMGLGGFRTIVICFDVRHHFSADDAIVRLPGHSILGDMGQDLVAEAGFPSCVTPLTLTIHRLPSRVQTPCSRSAGRIEYPGVDRFAQRVPTDALRAGHRGPAAHLDLELAEDRAVVVGPMIGSQHQGVGAFIDPIADQPLSCFSSSSADTGLVGQIAGAGHPPLAVLLHVDHRVTVSLGPLAGGCVTVEVPSSIASDGLRNRMDCTETLICDLGWAWKISAKARSMASRPWTLRPLR